MDLLTQHQAFSLSSQLRSLEFVSGSEPGLSIQLFADAATKVVPECGLLWVQESFLLRCNYIFVTGKIFLVTGCCVVAFLHLIKLA